MSGSNTSPKTPRSQNSYQKIFQELCDALRLSSESFDKGFYGEAKRLAVCVRVLLHDTNQSRSLFDQMGIKRTVSFSASTSIYSKNNLLSECHLVMAYISAQSTYMPVLDTGPFGFQRVPFDTWWGECVIRDKHRETFSRKELVLWYANKEGGAHVDPQLNERYRRLQDDNSYGEIFRANGVEVMPTVGVELACMRQIAHELIRTIRQNQKVIARKLGRPS